MDLAAAQLIFPVVCTDASLLSNCYAHVTEMLLCCSAFVSLDQKSPVPSSHFHSSISSISSAKEPHNALHTIKFIPKSDMLFYVETYKVFTSIRAGFTIYHTSHDMNRCIPHVHRARPLNGFENGPILVGNKIEYVLLTTWNGNSIFFSANRARPGSQKLPLNGLTEWNFFRNKQKACQNWE